MSNQDLHREEWIETLDSRVNELLDRGEVSKAQVILQALLPVEQADIFNVRLSVIFPLKTPQIFSKN